MIVEEKQVDLISSVEELESFIGNTPLYAIRGFHNNPDVKIYAKLEWNQLGNSVKARPAFNIIQEAVKSGRLTNGKHLLDASSGNTGVAYGAIGAALGIPVTLCIPENASQTKKSALKYYGVEIVYTSPFESTDGAQEKALELFMEFPDKYYYADQYGNDNNWKAHYNSTGFEVFRQTAGEVTHFVSGLGTSGTFTGTGKRLKELNHNIEIISLQPDFAMHGLEGWKHMETAKNPAFYNPNQADRTLEVATEKSYKLVKEVAKTNGLLLSPSSAANLAGAIEVANELNEGVVVTVFPDHGSNYPEVLKEIL